MMSSLLKNYLILRLQVKNLFTKLNFSYLLSVIFPRLFKIKISILKLFYLSYIHIQMKMWILSRHEALMKL